jgi:hypothetical protein
MDLFRRFLYCVLRSLILIYSRCTVRTCVHLLGFRPRIVSCPSSPQLLQLLDEGLICWSATGSRSALRVIVSNAVMLRIRGESWQVRLL